MSRPRRLDSVSYCGRAQYFLTFCTHHRRSAFRDQCVAADTMREFRRTSAIEKFAILAYCLMPDHAHLLVEGLRKHSELRRFAKMAKQRSGGRYARIHGERLWQEGYFERVLRDDDDPRAFARYIINNPVRAGLVESPLQYPLVGSDCWSLNELLESVV